MMRVPREAQGCLEAPLSGAAHAMLTILLITAVSGCGTERTESATASKPSAEPPAKVAVAAPAQKPASHPPTPAAPAAPAAPKRTGSSHRIELTVQTCIRFDPQWAEARVGDSVTWHSQLKSPITVHVEAGAFAKESYLVRPGATVSTGPALAAGNYTFWTDPTACHEAPRGALSAGPGVRVQEPLTANEK
jgi:plastocyanin